MDEDIPAILQLEDAGAADAQLAGSKAAALAEAARASLPVLPGFVVTTAADMDTPADVRRSHGRLRPAWERLSDSGRLPLVVRSSSTAEDRGSSSMAGRFASLVGVSGWDAFIDAMEEVVASREAVAEGDEEAAAPLAVLVQRQLDAACGGVMFGVDPVTGSDDHVIVSAVRGGPDRLVSGQADGSTYRLSPDGGIDSTEPAPQGAELDADQCRQLVELAASAAERFGGPQDVEWAFDAQGQLWLLQSRPITTAAGQGQGPVLGPGPVAETFPEPLYPLEEDLWLPPLRQALREAFRLTGTASAAALERSPLVIAVAGRPAVDLELFGIPPGDGHSVWERLDPRPRVRRLRASWRVGRLRAALPDLGTDLVERTDAELATVPPLTELSDRQLIALLDRASQALLALHGHEILVGLVTEADAARLTGTSVALRVLAEARDSGLPDDEIVARYPVVLALLPPRVERQPTLPDTPEAPPRNTAGDRNRPAIVREALRLRVRWVQELQARAAWELAERLAREGVVDDPELVRRLRLDELVATVRGRAVTWRLNRRRRQPEEAPLPAAFRLSTDGEVVPLRGASGEGGTGAGGGRGSGAVTHDAADPPEGAVLVVRTLDPQLATLLPRLGGLVAETGSVLAHVAILAREADVPTVVGLTGALDRFDEGDKVVVDGTTGDVRPADRKEEDAA